MSMDDWFWHWADRHIDAIPHDQWPPLDAEYWRQLRRMFIAKGVTPEVADRATAILFERKPRYPNEHPEALLAAVREIWRADREGRRPVTAIPSDEDGEEFNRRAYAHWATLDESERQEWLDLAAERCPGLCAQPRPREWMAMAWALDPDSVISPMPQPEPPTRGPRRLFDPTLKKV